METQENAQRPGHLVPDKLSFVAALCAVVGLVLLPASWGLTSLAASTHTNASPLRSIAQLGFGLSVVLLYLVAPILGAVAASRALALWRASGGAEVAAEHAKGIRTVARRLLLFAVSLALASGGPAILALAVGHHLLTATLGWLAFWLVGVALAAAGAGLAAYRLYRSIRASVVLRMGALATMVAVVPVVLALTPLPGLIRFCSQRAAYAWHAETFCGNSASLARTAVVPTLECPMPAGKNVVWCSSFQLAWNALQDDVIGDLVEVLGAEALAERLNRAPQSAADLEPESVYAAAGWTNLGITETIEKEMAARFPKHELPDFQEYREGVLAYAYLTAQVPFTVPFRQMKKPLVFIDSQGAETEVSGFGIWQGHLSRYAKMREQVEILHCRCPDERRHFDQMDEYVLDLCRDSEPYQVVVAVVQPKASLGETYRYVRDQAAQFKQREYYEEERQLSRSDILEVPEMFWEIDHRFDELIGKMVASVGMPIVEARQTLRFRLDRSGAMLETEALSMIAAIPRYFTFNRPFLIYMQKRGAAEPFFVMWVDNAELLTRR